MAKSHGMCISFGIIVILITTVVKLSNSEPQLQFPSQKPKVTPLSVQASRHPVYGFGSKLFNRLGEEKDGNGNSKNVIISPFSLRAALAIVYLGAKGQTAAEIQKYLQFSPDKGELVQNLQRQLNSTYNSPTSIYKIGNGLFIDKSTQLNERFIKILRDKLKVKIETLDFKGNLGGSISSINAWISQLTNGYIKNLIMQSSISNSVSLILTNALFFTGQWENPLKLLPAKGKFQTESNRKVPVDLMWTEATFGYSYLPELKSTAISLPFKDDRFEFIIIKPDEWQSVHSVRPLMLNFPLETLSNKLYDNQRSVTLKLPKFRLKANYDAAATLKKIGIKISLFDPDLIDLSGFLSPSAKQGRLVLSRMVHESHLDVNELGATAAAGTAITGYPIASSSTFEIDRPFIFLLNDRITGPVLIGQLMDPTQ